MEKKKIESFEDLQIWQRGIKLSLDTYKLFENCRDFGFRDQIQRASVSIPSNIAEGFERNTNKEFIQFLYIAKGSSGELRTQLILAINLGLIEKKNGTVLIEEAKTLSSMIFSLIKTRKSKF